MTKNNCTHKNTTNLSPFSHSEIKHIICLDCGWHNYNGDEYTKQEWEKWVNEGFEGRYNFTEAYWALNDNGDLK